MVRMQVRFSDERLRALREQAAADQASVSETVRRAVEQWIDACGRPTPAELRQRARAAAGRFGSGEHDVAEQREDYLADALRS
jgi:hypothetical protein